MVSTQTNLLERIQARSEAVAVPVGMGASQLVTWLKRPGERVEKYEPLAVVEADHMPTEICSVCTGTVRALMAREGVLLDAGAVLCYVEPDVPRPTAPPARLATARPTSGHVAPPTRAANGTPTSDQLSVAMPAPTPELTSESDSDAAHKRRSAPMRAVEGLLVETVAGEPAPSLPAPRRTDEREPRTQAKVYRVTPNQVGRVKKLALRVSADEAAPDGSEVTESELIRAAVEMLDALPWPALLLLVQENRRREQAGRYGTGWPRPKKPTAQRPQSVK